jgi:4'-phosphopantetheinyl transferase
LTGRTAPQRDEVHLWRAELDTSQAIRHWLGTPLSADERERARHYRQESDGARFACRRGWLRHLLADYLAVHPADLHFARDPRGKPRLGRPDVPWLRFNVSHSAGVAVFAVSRSREVGVDIEHVRRDFPFDEVARRFFSAEEHQALQALAPEDRIEAFFTMWTEKEAYLKGLGVGLSNDHAGERDKWRVTSFDAGAGFAASVAVEGGTVRVPVAAQPLTAFT